MECIVAMPIQLFYSTSIPVSLWILRKGKVNISITGFCLLMLENLDIWCGEGIGTVGGYRGTLYMKHRDKIAIQKIISELDKSE